MNGFLNVLKPPGMTSSDAVLFVRKRLPRGTKVGHGGTLDPEAAGVLPICVGKAARLFDYLIDKEKEYIAELTLGIATDTQDATGKVIARAPVCAGEAEIRAVLSRFTGDVQQIPPMFSAIKRDGKRLYELARKNESIDIEPRIAVVHAMDYLYPSGAHRHMLRVLCGKGTYIRTLMHDIGQALGCGGHMSFLLRSKAGAFDVENAVTLESIDETADISALLCAMDAPLAHLPEIHIAQNHLPQLQNGVAARREWYPESIPANAPVRMYCGGVFTGVGEADGDGRVRFRAMLL